MRSTRTPNIDLRNFLGKQERAALLYDFIAA